MNKTIEVTDLYGDYVLDNSYDCVIEVGGRFSGKSHNEQIRLVSNLASKENYKLLVIENLETGMADGFHAGLYERIREFEHDAAYTPETKVAHIRNKINDNQVIFRGYETEQQKYNVKKLSSITEILVEEGEWMTFNDFISLYQQLRGGNKEDRKLTVLMNPVNPDCFVNEHLIESIPDKVLEYFPNSKRPKVFEKSIKTTFMLEGKEITTAIKILIVLSTHYDNNFLTDEQRASIEQYRETDPDLYLQLGEARFIRPSGTYFKEFSKDIHVIEPFIIPGHWRRYLTVDYGLDMLAAHWIAVDEQNKAYVYKEYCESDLIASEAGKKLIELTDGEDIYEYIAPPDLDNRRQETGKSVIDIWAEQGLYFRICSNDRIQGWYNVKEYLKPYADEQNILTANLVIFENCAKLIGDFPKILRDEKKPNDCAKEPHDITHTLDAIRYFANARTYPTKPAKAADKYAINTVEHRVWSNLDNLVKNKSKKRKVYY